MLRLNSANVGHCEGRVSEKEGMRFGNAVEILAISFKDLGIYLKDEVHRCQLSTWHLKCRVWHGKMILPLRTRGGRRWRGSQ